MTSNTHQHPVRRGESGFGLIEIVVVIIVVAILFTIAVPTFLSQKKGSLNSSVVAAAQIFEGAAAEYQRSFPPVGGPDPLMTRNGFSGPFTPNLPPTQGLFSAAGDPLVKSWPTNPFTKQPVRVLRGACTTPGTAGDVLLCRPAAAAGGGPDLLRVRAIAWGRSSAGGGADVVVYDSETCKGPCPVE